MYDNENNRQDGVVCRANPRLAVCCELMLGCLLSLNAYANAEAFATMPIGESANLIIDVDRRSLDIEDLDSAVIVEFTEAESKPIHAGQDLSDVAHVDTSTGDQYSQLDPAGSQDVRSLDVVDTGSAVEFPKAVGELGGGIGDEKAKLDRGAQPVTGSNDTIDQGGEPEADSSDMSEQGDRLLVTSTSLTLPPTNIADVQGQVAESEGQLENATNDAVSDEEGAGLPYAVVLALLALIGLVPVARRNDHHRV